MSADHQQVTEFPKFLMNVDGELKLLPLKKAAGAFSSLFSQVEIAGQVHEADGKIRQITAEERNQICRLADEIDASK